MERRAVIDFVDTIIRTKEEADVFVMQIDDIIDTLYNQIFSFEKLLETHIPQVKKEKLLELFHKESVALTDREQIKQLLESIKEILLQKPILSLTLAFEPKQETFMQLKNWFCDSFGIMPLVVITIDRTILGGCIVSTNGYYKDYSLQKSLQEKHQSIFAKFIAYA